jgi:hypothetical protein
MSSREQRRRVVQTKEDKKEALMKKAIEYIINALFKVSVDILKKVNAQFQIYKKEKDIKEDATLEENIARGIVDEVFRVEFEPLQTAGQGIGKKCVRDYGVYVSIGAWFFCKEYLVRNGSKLQNVPIVWEPLDEYFKKFDKAQKEIQDAMKDHQSNLVPPGSTAAEIVAKAPPSLSIVKSEEEEK